jgi:O-antigen ligase
VLLIACASLTAGMAFSGVIGALEHFVPSLAIESDDPAMQLGTIGAVLDHDSLEGITLRRITGGLGDSNWLAATVAVVLPLNLFWWWMARGLLARSLVLAITGLQLMALVLSYTRAGFAGLGVAVVFLAWKKLIPVRLVAWGAVIAILIGLIWLPEGFMDRVFSVKYLEEGSTPMRQDLTGTALRFALERPILGYGYGQFGIEFVSRLNTDLSNRVGAWGFELARAIEDGRELARNVGAHNLYLEVMVEYGLLGLVPFVAFMILALRDLRCAERWGNEENRVLAICIAAGLIAFYVCGVFVHAKYLKILWFMTGLAAAQRRVVLTENQTPEHPPGGTAVQSP